MTTIQHKKRGVCVPRPSALILGPPALGPYHISPRPPNIARTKAYSLFKLYLFKMKTLYSFKIFKKLFRKVKLRCPK